jgi:hypothetical protein
MESGHVGEANKHSHLEKCDSMLEINQLNNVQAGDMN